jgi:glycosyltransferase involved in cell wall biosynthesis
MDYILSKKPLITTIIPTYRRPKLLARAIRSVLNQTYPHFQVCVYDNASGDETAAVVADIAKSDQRVKYHCHPRNIGGIQNFNYGIKEVTTPYFSLLADDNTLLSHFFEEAINTLSRYPEAILFAGQTILINERRQKMGDSLDGWDEGLIPPPNGLVDVWEKGLTWESVLFRSEVIKSAGLLDPSVNGSADQDFMMRLARKHVFYILKKPCALFLCHRNSWTASRDLGEDIATSKKILEHWLNDGDLSAIAKERIMKRWNAFVKEKIAGYLYTKSIVGDDTEAIALASKLMNEEVGLSYKPLRAIILAKLVNCNRFLRMLISPPIHWYIEMKHRLVILKNR